MSFLCSLFAENSRLSDMCVSLKSEYILIFSHGADHAVLISGKRFSILLLLLLWQGWARARRGAVWTTKPQLPAL
jgi:hypothetical protein